MGFKTKVKAGIRYVMNCRKEKIIEPIITPVVSDKLLSGKVALVTGGSSGIVLAISKAFLDAGAKVIIAGSNHQRLDSALAKLEPAGGGTVHSN